jgi:hypothetical protein
MNNSGGVTLTLLAGNGIPKPLPAAAVDLLEHVEIVESASERSGFQLIFGADRGKPYNILDYPLLLRSDLRPWSRIVVLVTINATTTVLADGLVTRQELQPSGGDPQAKLVITGEDVSVAMDLQQKTRSHSGQSENVIASKILLSYARYGITPNVKPPPVRVVPPPTRRRPMQHGTDLDYLLTMAARFGFVFYVRPGRLPLTNVAYWGPPQLRGLPQPALTVAMVGQSNVDTLTFRTDALAATATTGRVQDGVTDRQQNISIKRSGWPALARQPALAAWGSKSQSKLLTDAGGLTAAQARALAQGRTDTSALQTVVAEGELDALAYGGILRAAGLVGVRGVGRTHDGDYYVEEVTHELERGKFRQKFRLIRGGLGASKPLVRP